MLGQMLGRGLGARAVAPALLAALVLLACPLARAAPASIAVRVVGSGQGGAVIPQSFLGLSVETPALRSPSIAAPAPALWRLMRQLGPGVLRLSGVSVDRTQWLGSSERPAPWRIASIAPPDLRNLAALLSETGWRLLLGLNLGHPASSALVEEARAAKAILGGSLAGFEIGNEPDLYTRPPSMPFRALLGSGALRPRGWGLGEYESEISSLRGALSAAGVPVALFGPDTARPDWLESFAEQQSPGLAALAQHYYPLDRCEGGRVAKHPPSIAALLSARVSRREVQRIAALVRLAHRDGLPLRIDEANSVSCAGQQHTSDTFAAALWAVDFSLIAAQRGAIGVNFHGGLGSCALGGTIASPWYSPLCTLPGGQLHARPEYYALLLLRSLEGCAFVRASYHTQRNVDVYALRAPDGSLRVVIDDKETAGGSAGAMPPPAPVWVALHAARSYTAASVVRLSAPSAAARAGVSYGDATVAADGGFTAPTGGALAGGPGSFVVQVKPASVAVVTLASG